MRVAQGFALAFALASLAFTGLWGAPAMAQAAQGSDRSPNAGPITTSELTEAAELSGLAISPNGAFAIVRLNRDNISRNATELSWYRLSLRDGKAVRIGDAGQPLWGVNGGLDTVAPQWSADGRWIYYRGLKQQQVQVWRLKADGSRHEQVTHADADVEAFLLAPNGVLHYAVEGATRAEIRRAEAVEDERGVRVDATIIAGFPIVRSFLLNGRMATYRALLSTRRNFGRGPLLGDKPLRSLTMKGASHSVEAASADIAKRFADWWTQGGFDQFDPESERIFHAPHSDRFATVERADDVTGQDVKKSRSGQRLVWRQGGEGPANHVCRSTVCTDADGVIFVGWTADERGVVFQTTNFGASGIHVWDIVTDTVRTLIESKGVWGSHFSGAFGACKMAGAGQPGGQDREQAICLASAADAPPRVVGIDVRTGETRTLFDPNPDLSKDRLGVSEKIKVHDRWGGETYGYLVLPKAWTLLPVGARPRLPLVITSYTCPGFLVGGSGRDVPEHVLAGRGYAALCLDMSASSVRAAPGFDSAVRNSGPEQGLDFFEDAVRVLDQRQVIDAERVAITGFSASASVVTFSLTHSNHFATGVITTQGFLDPISCYLVGAFDGCRSYAKRQGYPLPYDSPTGRYADSSPAWDVAKIRTPLLMQLAEVEFHGMMQLFTAMWDYDRPVEMQVFAGEYHFKRQPGHRLVVYDRNLDWIDFWLKGEEASDTGRAEQYARWRVMRTRECELHAPDGKSDGKSAPQPWYCNEGAPRNNE